MDELVTVPRQQLDDFERRLAAVEEALGLVLQAEEDPVAGALTRFRERAREIERRQSRDGGA